MKDLLQGILAIIVCIILISISDYISLSSKLTLTEQLVSMILYFVVLITIRQET